MKKYTSIRLNWIQFSLWAPVLPMYIPGCLMMCSSHQAARSRGLFIWSISKEPYFWAFSVYFLFESMSANASYRLSSFISWYGINLPNSRRSSSKALVPWSIWTGIPSWKYLGSCLQHVKAWWDDFVTIGFWWQRLSWKDDWPMWEIKSLVFGWARISICGSHFDSSKLSGLSSMCSVSHFQMKSYSWNFRNILKNNSLLSSSIMDACKTMDGSTHWINN